MRPISLLLSALFAAGASGISFRAINFETANLNIEPQDTPTYTKCGEPQYGDIVTRIFLEKQIPKTDERFDFIIVGSTPAGSVLANRLSENPKTKVLLLDAGHVYEAFNDVPRFGPIASTSEYAETVFTPTNNYSCKGLINQQCKIIYGKGLGGSSNIDNMLYTRGNRVDYDKWESNVESEDWGYEEVLPCFKESERAILNVSAFNYFHGSEGPLSVEHVPYKSPVRDIFLKSAEEALFPNNDYNGHSQFGVSPLQAMMMNGKRHGAYHAYLEPIILNRPNLKVLIKSEVFKVIINEDTGKAIGVQFNHYNKEYKAFSTKEVIISAGAFGSPKLLMLSGIGPSKHLRELDIDVMADLPVGKSLYDQVAFPGITISINKTALPVDFVSPLNPKDHTDYMHGQGRLTIPYNIESLGFFSTRTDRKGDAPNIAIAQSSGTNEHIFNLTWAQDLFNFDIDEFTFPYYSFQPEQYFVNLLIVLLHPESKGTLKLRSANVADKPIVEPRYLHSDEDVEKLLKGIKFAKNLIYTDTMYKYGAKIFPYHAPGCSTNLKFDSDEYWRCAIRSIAVPNRSYAGTCRMGTKGDPKTVVTSNFKVLGIRKLRVIDNSIIPVTISGYNAAVSYMIGEKGAATILNEYEKAHKNSSEEKHEKSSKESHQKSSEEDSEERG